MGVHDGHRERMRNSFMEHGLESFNEINALELLLFYAKPRIDTNPLAHALLDRFGSLAEIFDASEEELCEVPGVGRNTAALIKLVPEMMRKAEITRTSDITQILNSREAEAYLKPRFMNERNEKVLVLYLDSQMKIIRCVEHARGDVNMVSINVRLIIEQALKFKASYVILSHNHPDGNTSASGDDIAVTKTLMKSLQLVNIKLYDHFIVSERHCLSMRSAGALATLNYF